MGAAEISLAASTDDVRSDQSHGRSHPDGAFDRVVELLVVDSVVWLPWRLRGSVGAGDEPERFVDFARAPHTVKQYCELPGHCDNGTAIGPGSSSFQDALPKPPQVDHVIVRWLT